MSDTPSGDTILASGVVTAPGAGVAITSLAIPGSVASGIPSTGLYRYRITSYQMGTIDTGHEAGVQLQHGGKVVGPLLTTPIETVTEGYVTLTDGETLSVNAIAAFAAASVVAVTIALTRIG